MTQQRGPFALRRPNGSIDWRTIAATPDGVWSLAYDVFPASFRRAHWKQWDASIAAAKRDGYSFVEVDVVERQAPGGRCPHGEPIGECNACDVAGDFAFDAAREAAAFRR